VGNSVVVLHQGFDYQARWFWIEGLRLFRSEPVLERVAIEAPAPRGFDDVVSYPVRPRDRDVWGQPVGIDGFQAKFHADQSRLIRAADLANPLFIGAQTSLLERLRAATAASNSDGRHGRFTLVTPWHVDRNDLLGRILSPAGELRMSVLFDGRGLRSESGKLRKFWREHLGLGDDDVLQDLLRHFRILERDVEQTNREIERELLPLAQEEQLAVIPFNPLAGGLLTGKYRHGEMPDNGRFSVEVGKFGEIYQDRYWHKRQFETVEKLGDIAKLRGEPLAKLSIAWVLANPVITSAILGASRLDQLTDTLAAVDLQLDGELKKHLDELTVEYRRGDAIR